MKFGVAGVLECGDLSFPYKLQTQKLLIMPDVTTHPQQRELPSDEKASMRSNVNWVSEICSANVSVGYKEDKSSIPT